jgi:cytochrome c peroxidase
MEKLRIYLLLLVVFLNPSYAQEESYTSTVLAPGYNQLTFDAPVPGSYTLASYKPASNGNVIDADGLNKSLHDIYDDKIVLLNFMYSTCADINGCPLATAVFHKIKNILDKDPVIGKQVSMISLSFDPENDSPDVMKLYGDGTDSGSVDWKFLTTNSIKDLDPILDKYSQRIIKEYDEKGNYIGSISHILRVFLIDKDKKIRSIYSVSFLHSDVLINDIKTLLHPESQNGTVVVASTQNVVPAGSFLARPGDSKKGYESGDYVTDSQTLERVGQATNLYAIANSQILGLPELNMTKGTDLTREKIALGRKMFYDRRLSHTDTISCAICHVPEMGFAHNELATAVGTEGRSVPRNSPSILNTALLSRLFHDGREHSLENQVWGPLLSHNEMANPSPGYLINKIRNIPDYENLFEEAYGTGPSIDTISKAFSAYEYTLLSGNSAFDRWYYGGERNAISNKAKEGFKLFSGKGACVTCHLVGEDSTLFTDEKLHNTGIGFKASMHVEPPTKQLTLVPGLTIEIDTSSYRNNVAFKDEIAPNDLGLYTVTQDPNDRWKFRTSGLRNVEITAPYMHNGSLQTLKEVVEFYNKGGIKTSGKMKNDNISPLMFPLSLSENEVDNIVEFLKTLTGSNVNELILDAKAAPIGEISLEDPNWFHENKPKY